MKIFVLLSCLTLQALLGATIWPSSTVPSVLAAHPTTGVELGIQFQSDVAGTITGVRFWKDATNTGPHIGTLWSSSGTKLATTTFTGETASGWQQMNFSVPVSIAANTVYVASYHTATAFSQTLNYFAGSVDAPPLHALAANGVYVYGGGSTASVFPTSTYLASNYWVDVVFQATPPPSPSPIALSAGSLLCTITPAAAAVQVLCSGAGANASSSYPLPIPAPGTVGNYSLGTNIITWALVPGGSGATVWSAAVNGGTLQRGTF